MNLTSIAALGNLSPQALEKILSNLTSTLDQKGKREIAATLRQIADKLETDTPFQGEQCGTGRDSGFDRIRKELSRLKTPA